MALDEANIQVEAESRKSPKTHTPFGVKNVLLATDFSATSEAALPYATAICRRFGSTLHLAHVLSDANVLLLSGGVDYVSMGTLYEDAHAEANQGEGTRFCARGQRAKPNGRRRQAGAQQK